MKATHLKISKLTRCGLFTAIICLCSWITVPTVVPFTLQTLGIYLSVGILGGKMGFCSVATYIALGMVGLPVFSNFQGGIGVLLGASGGYIWGFVVAVAMMWLLEKIFGRGLKVFVVSQIFATLICYFLGSVWYYFVYIHRSGSMGFAGVISTCVLPFILPDVAKIALSTVLTKKLRKTIF